MVSQVVCRFVKQRAAVTGLTGFESSLFIAGSCDNIRFFNTAQKSTELNTLIPRHMIRTGNRTCFSGVVTSLLVSLVRFNCARYSGVEHVSRIIQGCEIKTEGLGALSRIVHAMWMHHVNVFV